MSTDAASHIKRREKDVLIDVADAATIMDTSPQLVLHRIRLGHLHLSRREVAALALSEKPRREALAEFVRLSEEIDSQMSVDGPTGNGHDDKDFFDER